MMFIYVAGYFEIALRPIDHTMNSEQIFTQEKLIIM